MTLVRSGKYSIYPLAKLQWGAILPAPQAWRAAGPRTLHQRVIVEGAASGEVKLHARGSFHVGLHRRI
ncbi:Uncharacterized protein HZ326_29654 [Fusarium oxysporum f. sp. albedinis]|nr:Uncharacterized protein HZ326_29654 [Fusarium oxysporum f. sp. albedinis]